MKKIFAEFGIGNETILSTEIEEAEYEYRLPKFLIPKKISEFYLRFWIMKTVFIISSLSGFKIKKKDKYKFKLLLGIGGTDS